MIDRHAIDLSTWNVYLAGSGELLQGRPSFELLEASENDETDKGVPAYRREGVWYYCHPNSVEICKKSHAVVMVFVD